MSKSIPTSAYDMNAATDSVERRTFATLVRNEPGVLARVVGLFSARGYNIESLTVAETDKNQHTSRITIVTSGTKAILTQIKAQIETLVPVVKVIDVTQEENALERELALVKVIGVGENRIEAMRVSEIFRARVIDVTNESFVFELTGATTKIDQFIELMRPLGLIEASRTGVLSLNRGKHAE